MKLLTIVFLVCGLAMPLSAGESAKKAAGQSIEDMHRMLERSFRLTDVGEREKATIKRATSRTITIKSYVVLGARGRIEYCIVTDLDKASGTSMSRIVVKTRSSEAVEDANTLLPSSPRKTGSARKRQWNGYTLQYHKKDVPVELASQYSDTLTRKARFDSIEELTIPIDTSGLVKPVRFGSSIRLTMHSKISMDMQLEIPFAFLAGYLAKLADEGFLPEKDQVLMGKLRDAIRAQSGR